MCTQNWCKPEIDPIDMITQGKIFVKTVGGTSWTKVSFIKEDAFAVYLVIWIQVTCCVLTFVDILWRTAGGERNAATDKE